MRRTVRVSAAIAFSASLIAFGFAGKKDKKKAAEPPPAAEAPAPAPEPTPAPEPEPAPEAAPAEKAANADFKATVTFADGTTKAGHVKRVERGDDWYAERGWVDDANKLTVNLQGNGTEVDKAWTDIASIDVKYGGKGDIDCTYESEYTPWMYSCLLRSTTTVKTTDGKTWQSGSKHKWRFVFDDGSTAEFYIYKLPAREQDSQQVELDTTNPENYELYGKLQAQLMKDVQSAVTKIVITK